MIAARRERWPYVVVALVLFPAAVLYGRSIYAPCDDMYIYLVYVKNLVEGNGLTYNGTVVDGFSSPLWIGLLSLLGVVGLPLPGGAEALSIGTGLAALIATFALSRRVLGNYRWALVPPLLLACTGDFAFYMCVGLEEVLFTALATLCVMHAWERDAHKALAGYRLPLLMAATILARPEGVLIALVVTVVLAVRGRSALLGIRCAVISALVLAPVLVMKWKYYGYVLPNTYYVKGNAGLQNIPHGLRYVLGSVPRYGVLACAGLCLVLYALRGRRLRALRAVGPGLLVCGVWTLYVVAIGGDNMVGGRVFLPILPVGYAVLIRLAQELGISRVPVALATAVACFVMIVGYLTDQFVYVHRLSWIGGFQLRRDAGVYLRENFPPNTLVALSDAGTIPYYSGLPTIDMLGLNDAHIAHEGYRDRTGRFGHQAGDGAYVLSRRPDVILFGGMLSKHASKRLIGDRQIWGSREFHDRYRLEHWFDGAYAYVRKTARDGRAAPASGPDMPGGRGSTIVTGTGAAGSE